MSGAFRWTNFLVKWNSLAIMTFVTLAVTSSIALSEYLRERPPELRGVPTLSTAVFAVPYAREVFVLSLLSIVFLTERCGDVAASVTAWIFILSFHNAENNRAHTLYASVAGALSVALTIASPAVPKALKVLVLISASAFIISYNVVREVHSPYYVSEYVCIILIISAAFFRVRAVCSRTGSNSPLLCVAGC